MASVLGSSLLLEPTGWAAEPHGLEDRGGEPVPHLSPAEQAWFRRGSLVVLLLALMLAGTALAVWRFQVLGRERARLMETLERSNRTLKRFREQIDHALDAVYMVRPADGRILNINHSACVMLGYSRKDLLGKHIYAIDARINDAERLDEVVASLTSRGAFTFESEHRRRDGSVFPVEVCMSYACDPEGDYAIGVVRDISARKAAEAATRRFEERYRQIVERAHVGIFHYGQDLVIRLANPSFSKLVGLAPDAHVGFDLERLEDRRLLPALRMPLRGEAGHYEGDYVSILAPTPFWIDVHCFPIYDDAGRPVGGVAVVNDLTERRRTELELIQSREEAEAANRAKSLFLANMSHEIRTPFDAVIGLLQLLEQTSLDGRQRSYVDKAQASARSLLVLLGDLLDFARIESGKLELEETPFSLIGLIGEVLTLSSAAAGAKGLELTSDIDPELDDAWVGDMARLRQVLTNLVGNAVKFTQRGAVRIQVGGEPADARGTSGRAMLRFSVSDTGIGIAPGHLELIFERFQQEDPSMTRELGGTGLGLAICKGLLDLLGGEISVESTLGQGSCFSFAVPLMRGLVPNGPSRPFVAQPGPSRPGALTAWRPLAGLRLLVAEDGEVNRLVAREMLIRMGASVDVAENGEAAVSQVFEAELGYDLVLMDLQMPRMSGLDAARHLRTRHGAEDLPILAMTANVRAADREACAAAGMNGFLAKPIDWPAAARRILELRGRADAPASLPLSASAPTDVLASACGLDLRGALDRLDGSMQTYCAMARRFLDAEQETRSSLMTSLEQGASAAAAKQLHTLRGAALSLGVLELADFAHAFEDALSIDLGGSVGTLSAQLFDLWSQTVTSLRQVVAGLEAQEAQRSADASKPSTVEGF